MKFFRQTQIEYNMKKIPNQYMDKGEFFLARFNTITIQIKPMRNSSEDSSLMLEINLMDFNYHPSTIKERKGGDHTTYTRHEIHRRMFRNVRNSFEQKSKSFLWWSCNPPV